MTKKAMQSDAATVLLELGCSQAVEVVPETQASQALKDVDIVYTPFSDIDLLPHRSWCCIKGLVLESEPTGEGELEVKLVDDSGLMIPLCFQGAMAQSQFEEGTALTAVMVQVSRKYGNLTVTHESRIAVATSDAALPSKIQAVFWGQG